MIIHVQPEYEFYRFFTLFVSPSGSVTVNNYNPKKKPVWWWPVNWIIVYPLLLVVTVYCKATGK